ncbi:hypothetical protein NKDENANG_02088 [Candidatus Entotheonellaceae bacterium PAL068K]
MKRAVALVVALGMVAVFSGVALAGGGFGECSYSSHTSQAARDKVDTSKPVATQVLPKAETDKLIFAKTDKSARTVVTTKR